MSKFNTINGGVPEQQGPIIGKTEETVNGINKKLLDIFGIKEEETIFLTQVQIEQLSDENEINSTEAQLAKMFGKYDEMIELNDTRKQPISLTQIMLEYDKSNALTI